jgi:hypothetical protein
MNPVIKAAMGPDGAKEVDLAFRNAREFLFALMR